MSAIDQNKQNEQISSITCDSIKTLLDKLVSRISDLDLSRFPTLLQILGNGIDRSTSPDHLILLHKKIIALFALLQISAYSGFNGDSLNPLKEDSLEQIQIWLDDQVHFVSKDFQLLHEFYSLKILPLVPRNWADLLLNFYFAIRKIPKITLSSLFGPIFSDILPFTTRKQLASYYTKPNAADLMAAILIQSGKESIFDPACGAGQLLGAASRWKSMCNLTQPSSLTFNGSLYGIELVPFAARLAQLSLALWYDIKSPTSSSLVHIVPGDTFSTLPTLSWAYQQFDLIMANPPFTKQQNIATEFKQFLLKKEQKGFKSKKIAVEVENVMGLHFYYLDLIRVLLPIGGRCGLIIPLNISYSHTGKEIIRRFLQSIQIDYIIGSEMETAFSEGSNIAEIMVIGTKIDFAKNHSTEAEHLVQCVTLLTKLSEESLRQIIPALKSRSLLNTNFRLKQITQQALIADLEKKGWYWLFTQSTSDSIVEEIRPSLIPLQNLLDDNHLIKERGINVPADFFFLPNPSWKILEQTPNYVIIKSQDSESIKLEIPKTYLVPIIRKPEYYKKRALIDSEQLKVHYLLSISPNTSSNPEFHPSITQYMTWGIKNLDISNRSNTKSLSSNWIHLGNRAVQNKQPTELILCFKWDPRYRSFLVNWTSQPTYAGQAFWHFKCDNSELELGLATWLNSTFGMILIGEQASFQRRVWRQLTGPSINHILIPSITILKKIGSEFRSECLIYLQSDQSDSLKNQLFAAIKLIKDQQSNPRILIDRLFLSFLLSQNAVAVLNHQLLDFYQMFLNDLQNSLEFLE